MADSSFSRVASSSYSKYTAGCSSRMKYPSYAMAKDFPSYDSLDENIHFTLTGKPQPCARMRELVRELRAFKFQIADWNDPVSCQLENLLTHNLYEIFQKAIAKIATFGYTEEVAKKAVLRSRMPYGGQDLVLNVVDDALNFLDKEKEYDTASANKFEDLEHLVNYTLLEMICVLREIKPFLTVADAMWCLLLSDMNILSACVVEDNPLTDVGIEETTEETPNFAIPQLKSKGQSFSTRLPYPIGPDIPKHSFPSQNSEFKSLRSGPASNLYNKRHSFVFDAGLNRGKQSLIPDADTFQITGEICQITSQMSTEEEKVGMGSKIRKEMKLQEKSFQLKGSCCAYRGGKLSSSGYFVVESKTKSSSNPRAKHMKKFSSQIGKSVGVKGCQQCSSPVLDSTCTGVSMTRPSTYPLCTSCAENFKPFMPSLPPGKNTTSEPQSKIHEISEMPDYYAEIPYDKSQGKYIPQNKKDEVILKLVPRLQTLQWELTGWVEWANQKVMQAMDRLCKDRKEVKKMKQEKKEPEKIMKDQPTLVEHAIERISEMKLALRNGNCQIEKANITLERLEAEQVMLKKEMEIAKLHAAKSAASCEESIERDQETLKNAESYGSPKVLLNEELMTKKRKVTDLQKEIEKATDQLSQIEARWKNEHTAKEKLFEQAVSIRKEREELEALEKEEKDTIWQQAWNGMQKHSMDIKSLEVKLSQLRFTSDSSRIGAVQSVTGGSYPDCLPKFMKVQAQIQKGNRPPVPSRVANSMDITGSGGVTQERECVMCLTEEKSVVFLPCAHQVLCPTCNEHHEKRQMKDCPSCRTPIQRRITVSFAHV